MSWLTKFFKLKENGTTVRREIYTGTIMFLAVSYILAVNPEILGSTGMHRGGLFYVTALAAFLGTLIMALLANSPLVLAPAMGLNAFFAFSVVGFMGYSWQFALFAIVLEGIIFFLLSLSSIREKIINTIPLPLKYAIGAGIGLYITLIAFKSAHVIKGHPVTLVTIQDFFGPDFNTSGISAILAITGAIPAYLLITGIVFTYNISDGLGAGDHLLYGSQLHCQGTGKLADGSYFTAVCGEISVLMTGKNFQRQQDS